MTVQERVSKAMLSVERVLCSIDILSKRLRHYIVNPVLSVDGFIALEIVKGSMDGAKFYYLIRTPARS